MSTDEPNPLLCLLYFSKIRMYVFGLRCGIIIITFQLVRGQNYTPCISGCDSFKVSVGDGQ